MLLLATLALSPLISLATDTWQERTAWARYFADAGVDTPKREAIGRAVLRSIQALPPNAVVEPTRWLAERREREIRFRRRG
jgi:hypothetical protein